MDIENKLEDFVIEIKECFDLQSSDRKKYTTLVKYNGKNPNVVIPDGVEIIGDSAFAEHSLADDAIPIKSVVMPNSVLGICDGAFTSCSNLESVVMSDHIRTLGVAAFSFCSSLKTLELPETLTNIKAKTFYGCESLESLYIRNAGIYIRSIAFQNNPAFRYFHFDYNSRQQYNVDRVMLSVSSGKEIKDEYIGVNQNNEVTIYTYEMKD